jgi:hypothetical protein
MVNYPLLNAVFLEKRSPNLINIDAEMNTYDPINDSSIQKAGDP